MEKIQIFTDLTIKPKSGNSLKRYFDSFKRDLPDKWNSIKNIQYEDVHTFKIINDVLELQTPWYTNDATKTTFSANILLGLTDESIIVLKINFSVSIDEEYIMEHLGFVIELLHNEILKPKKNYDLFNHEFKLGGVTDENWSHQDIREERLIRIHSKADNRVYALAKGDRVTVDGKELFYTPPNNISLSLSIMKKSYKRANGLYKKLLPKNATKKIELRETDKYLLYDFFEACSD